MWQHLYNAPLFDLGDTGNDKLRGIFSPFYDQSVVDRYVHTQFTEGAHTYAERYHAAGYFSELIATAFQSIGWSPQDRDGLVILDIGSGAGNSIFPLLKLCPDSLVIASDLSVEMLVVLKESLAHQGMDGNNCALLQLNAQELDFRPESFDFVIGAAVLHHLLAPESTFAGCAKILRRGGFAIFFEPFENGNALLRIIYHTILHHPRHDTLCPDVSNLFQTLIWQFDTRKGRDKSLPIFQHMDDKWLFTKQYIGEMAEKYKFSHCIIYPLHSTEHQFELQTEANLRLGIGKSRDVLPEWAWEIIRQYDQCFSEDMKKELLIEGCMILKK